MTLLAFKWVATFSTLIISLLAGFATPRFITKYQKRLKVGDSAANGLFIGAALFLLVPNAEINFHLVKIHHPIFYIALLAFGSFFFLWSLDKKITQLHQKNNLITLSINSFIAGIILGFSNSLKFVLIILFAVLAHKCFEIFALLLNFKHRPIRKIPIYIKFIAFSCIIPLGIWLGAILNNTISNDIAHSILAIFESLAAGTFFYIGIMHKHHRQYHLPTDSYHRYNEVLSMIIGIIVMGIAGIWI